MDLQSGRFYWDTTFIDPPEYPSLAEDIQCDVLIIGAGSSGAQVAYDLKDTGLNVVVIDQYKAGMGSTRTNTALVQYLGDKMTYELVNSFGEEAAMMHTTLCRDAINHIEKASKKMRINPDFRRRDTLYRASTVEDIEKLKKDFHFLSTYKFDADLITQKKIEKHYPFTAPAAIYSKNDADLNPFKHNHGLLDLAHEAGVRVYEQTEISGKKINADRCTYYTKSGFVIEAKHVVVAAGYESLTFQKNKNAVLESSYCIVTSPVDDLSDWYRETLIWETARPYVYMRTTVDGRILVGGLDETTPYPDRRDSMLLSKRDNLVKEFNKLFPDISIEAEYYYGAFFGGTHDGLPILYEHKDSPHHLFLLAYGDNGLVYSNVLSSIVKEKLTGGKHEAEDLYSRSPAAIRS
ncbi:FAD-binding oxidoreductase [Jeotgalibacillus sp. R-1-5s-1]|uniref:NAD(P)/FAD-dependent oxidoreductase n=1 Tax=Jeotgalibacillus sp. R-1-5s-1 TaxID=2555897 RepID=UPI00106CDD57|nr:FAD-dependent oxidoreductase [Jeotgalibacillus sp. R-1-5s-1]TFE00067.1 FAD-binding oxidoreductase [Jeotgalibacillus sp. R-1-5s-1]